MILQSLPQISLSVPGVLFSVSGSPVTGSGGFALNLINQSANTVLAGPSSGGAAAPTMRSLVLADLPAGVPLTSVANTWLDTQTISLSAPSHTGLIVKGAASQSGNLQAWQDSTGNSLAWVTPAGSVRGADVGSTSGRLFFKTTGGTTGLVYGFSDGNLTDSSGVGAYVSISPQISQSGTAGYTGLLINPTETTVGSGAKKLIDCQIGGVSGMWVDNGCNINWRNGGQLNYNPNNQFLALLGFANVSLAGPVTGITSLSCSSETITSTLASTIPLTIKGAAAQSGNLTEWRNSSGTLLAYMDSGANFYGATAVTSTYLQIINITNRDYGTGRPWMNVGVAGWTLFVAGSPAYSALMIQGMAGQTAALQKWQDANSQPLLQVLAGGQLQTAAANESTGSGSAALGSNSPAITNAAPYTWLKFTASDGSQVYVPAWK